MKFYTKKAIRFVYRYVLIGLFVVLPLLMMVVFTLNDALVIESDKPYMIVTLLVLECCGVAIVYFWFMEKCFATLQISDGYICWRSPLRKKLVLSIKDCRFAGVENEDSFNGLPYPYIYVSYIPYPDEYKNKINKLKCSDNFIKFWYSDELCKYLEKELPKGCAGTLTAYRVYRKYK